MPNSSGGKQTAALDEERQEEQEAEEAEGKEGEEQEEELGCLQIVERRRIVKRTPRNSRRRRKVELCF